jgi:Pectate lyase superfamily protein/Right handed beta helix region
MEGWFSVKDPCFDAKGTGSVDDTVTIQACIDFVAARGGGTVYLPPGQYLVSAPGERAYKLLLKSNVSIRGAGRSSLLVSALNQNMGARTLASDSASLLSCVTLADFAIDGRETANPHPAKTNHQRAGIFIENSEDVTIKNLDIKDTADVIRMYGPSCERTVIEGCSLHDCPIDIGREVIQGEGLRNSQIINNKIWNCNFATAVKMENAVGGIQYNNIVSGNVIRNVGSGILMAGGLIIANNIIEGASVGPGISAQSHAIISGNRINGAMGNGIGVFNNTSSPINVRISNNQVRGVDGKGEPPVGIDVSSRVDDAGVFYVPTNITVESNDIEAFAGMASFAIGVRFEQVGGVLAIRGNRIADAFLGISAGPATTSAIDSLDISHNQITVLANGRCIAVGAKTDAGLRVNSASLAFNTCMPAAGAGETQGIHVEGNPDRLTLIGNNSASCAIPYGEFVPVPSGPTNKISVNNQGF